MGFSIHCEVKQRRFFSRHTNIQGISVAWATLLLLERIWLIIYFLISYVCSEFYTIEHISSYSMNTRYNFNRLQPSFTAYCKVKNFSISPKLCLLFFTWVFKIKTDCFPKEHWRFSLRNGQEAYSLWIRPIYRSFIYCKTHDCQP
jgi:hypothetical protein